MMAGYLAALRSRDFRLLWTGATLSLVGDGATWIAMAWIAVTRGGPHTLAILGVCYTAPVLLGGVVSGTMIDRVSRRMVLVVDSVFRAGVVLSVPLAATEHWFVIGQLYLVAGVYGLLKILPVSVLPTVVPDLVPAEHLRPALALEAAAASMTGLLGPSLGALLVAALGAQWVLAVDGATYLYFALSVLRMTDRLERPPAAGVDDDRRQSWIPVLQFLWRDHVMLVITVTFGLLNVGMGALTVAQPWLAHDRLAGGAWTLAVMVTALDGASLLGSLVAGAVPSPRRPVARIGLLQLAAGAPLLLMLHVSLITVVVAQVACGGPLTLLVVTSQALRYERTPAAIRGRTMTLMRTIMLGAVPAGSALAGLLLGAGRYQVMVVVMAATVGLPGLLTLAVGRRGQEATGSRHLVGATREG